MYGTCGRIDNKADFDFDFDYCIAFITLLVIATSDAKSDSFPQTGSFRTVRLIEPVQKADSSAPDVNDVTIYFLTTLCRVASMKHSN